MRNYWLILLFFQLRPAVFNIFDFSCLLTRVAKMKSCHLKFQSWEIASMGMN